MNRNDIDALAAEMLQAQEQGTVVALPSTRYIPFGLGEAYAVGQRIVERRQARGETPVGRKIGYTNRSIWAEYGVDSPMWAHVYDTTLQHAPGGQASLDLSGAVAPRIEPEIVLGLRATPAGLDDDEQALLDAVEWCALGFEVVDCHLPNWKMTIADGIADFGLHKALIVGKPLPIDHGRAEEMIAALREVAIELRQGDETSANGKGSNALGSSLLSLGYLCSVLSSLPESAPLAAGEVVTTGTVTQAMPIQAGQRWTVSAQGLDLEPLTISFQ